MALLAALDQIDFGLVELQTECFHANKKSNKKTSFMTFEQSSRSTTRAIKRTTGPLSVARGKKNLVYIYGVRMIPNFVNVCDF